MIIEWDDAVVAMADATYVPTPADIAASQLLAFVSHCELATGRSFADHEDFHSWSVAEYRHFWQLLLAWSGIVYDGDPALACRGDDVESAEFFPDLRLNYVENLLRVIEGHEDRPAVIAHRSSGARTQLTRSALREQVCTLAAALQRRGLAAGDRVVAVSANTEQLVVAALAVLAVGATLSTAAPDMGVTSVLARFAPLEPSLLLMGTADPAYAEQLAASLPTLRRIVRLDTLHELLAEPHDGWVWPRLPFNQPLFILFSSGTTGPPKCIVHSAGGVLLEHRKEHVLHEDLRAGDTLFFHTSPAWMMWNWQLSALGAGAALVLYDGRVTGAETLWSIVAAEHVTAFGTGPSYLRFCQTAGFSPGSVHDLAELRLVMSTGAVLRDEQFDWLAREVGPVALHSISGGTDIVGCFVLGAPTLPVFAGESPCRTLGLDVRALDPDPATGVGELVCANPFPSRPLGLYGDADGQRFHRAYFAANPGLWTHGDRIEITPHGSVRMHGRSDGVLNVGGVRIGPAEIYAVVNSVPGVAESVVVEQQVTTAVDTSRLLLLVIMTTPGTLDDATELAIRQHLTRHTTRGHVPRLIVEVPDLPHTFSGKVSETAVRDAVNGVPVANVDALDNPQSLQQITAAVAAADRRPTPATEASGDRVVDAIRAIFAEILGLASVGADDSFFDLGGTSLALAAARQAIYQRLGHDIALSAIFSAPRPRALARYLEGDGDDGTLVTLRAGTAARPVFVLHDMSGDVLGYTHLVGALPGDRPVLGVRSRALDPRLPADRTTEDMAAHAVACIRRAQPAGPYTLVGYSFGGLLAWEVAQRLHAAGERVDTLVLIDSFLGAACLGPLRGRWFVMVTRPMVQLRYALKNPRSSLHALINRLRRRPAVAPESGPSRTPLADAFERLVWEQFPRYRPLPYAGDVVFVRSEIRDQLECDPVSVWQHATLGDFRLMRAPGGHHTAIEPPLSEALAHRLGALLG